MSPLFRLHERPDLDSPVLIVALEGWIDAGLGAGTAIAHVLETTESATVAAFDTDELLDYRARRPIMHLVEGVNTRLTWPALELRVATDLAGNDLLLLVGAEPDHQWKAFSNAVVDLAFEFGVRMVIGFGAYPAPTPHTRPARLACTASTAELARAFGFVHATVDVPAGVQGAIERQCAEAGMPALGLWAQVPHYAAAMPYPAAGAALIEGLGLVAGLSLDAGPLHEAGAASRARLDALIEQSTEHQALVRQLEEQVDAASAAEPDVGETTVRLSGDSYPPGMQVPSGDELAAELERFLREQGEA